MSKDFSYNHPFELAYWQYGLTLANAWRERQGKARNAEWDKIAQNMAPLPQTKDGIYTAGLPKGKTTGLKSFDPFDAVASGAQPVVSTETFEEKCRNDHPAVLGPFGMLPAFGPFGKQPSVPGSFSKQSAVLGSSSKQPSVLGSFGKQSAGSLCSGAAAAFGPSSKQSASSLCSGAAAALKTLSWVMDNWNWPTTWGWDYGMTAMAAARLGQPETALQALLIDTQKNTYLKQGHNFQTADRLRIYLPGNGALLTAVAMMCAGWDGCE